MKIHITSALLFSLTASAATAFTSPLQSLPRSFSKPATRSSSSTLLYASTLERPTTTENETTSAKSSSSSSSQPAQSSSTSKSSANTSENKGKKKNSFGEQMANSGLASAAAVATAAVNAAVAMKSLEAPDVKKSYIALDKTDNALDEDGLPLVYDKDLIESYWTKERGALNQRWGTFVGKAVPFLTKLTTLFIRDGKIVDHEIPALSRQARLDLQDLGPTFIKAGQMMSVRPDVLPQSTLDELTQLQDAVVPFDTETAVAQIEQELGGPLGQFFTSISQEPVAAASLAQVYLATLNDGKDTRVAVKVQRPQILSTVSKDLYVLRRAAEVFQGLIERFAPQQRTNYVALLNEWAIGFYTELDFLNEAQNQRTLRQMLIDKNITTQVTVPRVFDEYCTRRILVSEWMDGKKLSMASTEQIAAVTPAAQEAFLTQLFEVGFFHADPHPGNLLLLDEPTEDGAELALIDCGLMASIESEDRDNMISAVIHLANKDYASLVDDFIKLQILPADSNRAAIIPLMDKALSPYVKGGGAKKYEEELKRLYNMEEGNMKSQVGGFQAMTQDALTVLNDIPFSIPPYFAILGRAIVTLEGVALTGNPDYGIIMETYPFIARKLLREGRPEIQKALQEVLYSGGDNEKSGLKLTRLLALLNNAAGSIATQEGAAFVDLDSIPEDGLSLKEGLRFVLSDNADSLRSLLESEVDNAVDVVSRQIVRRAIDEAVVALTPPRPPALPLLGNVLPAPPFPKLDEIPFPILVGGSIPGVPGSETTGTTTPGVAFLTLHELRDTVAPKLSRDEEIFAIGLAEGASEFFGDEIGDLIKGERVLSAQSAGLLLRTLRNVGGGGGGGSPVTSNAAAQSVIAVVQESVKNLLAVMDRRRAGSSSARASSSNEDGGDELWAAVQDLSPSERTRLDSIVEELTERALTRTLERLSKVERII